MTKTVEELEKELADSKAKAEENVKALQKKLSEKDLETKKFQDDLEQLKKNPPSPPNNEEIIKLSKTVEGLTSQIGDMEREKKKEELRKKFPDILPEFLLDKNDEERELIVNKQRKIIEENYGSLPSAHQPVYKNRNEIDEAIKGVSEDRTLSTDQKLAKVRELKLKKDDF